MVNWRWGGSGGRRRSAKGAVFYPARVAGGEREGHLDGVPRKRIVA